MKRELKFNKSFVFLFMKECDIKTNEIAGSGHFIHYKLSFSCLICAAVGAARRLANSSVAASRRPDLHLI